MPRKQHLSRPSHQWLEVLALTQQQVMLTTQRINVWVPSTAPGRCGRRGRRGRRHRGKRRSRQQAVHPILVGVDKDQKHPGKFCSECGGSIHKYIYIYNQ